MYLSEVRLINWRSYQDATFRFPKPPPDRPLVLVGAMNGHGKTSFLLGLYLGMFGRFGTRFAEGFQLGGDEMRALHYRRALQEFRRRAADPDDPTEVHVCISPTDRDGAAAVEFRIERRWFFNSTGAVREKGEAVAVYINGVPQKLQGADEATELIESDLFPAHILPAFFFDGEQAQRRIEDSGDVQMRQAVEVLYGTKVLDELRGRLGDYISRCREDMPDIGESKGQRQIDQLRRDRDEIISKLDGLAAETTDLEQQKRKEADLFDAARQQLEALGLSGAKRLDRLAERLHETRTAVNERDQALRLLADQLALPMGLTRLVDVVLRRLDAEEARERWEALRDGTQARTDDVVARALPTPDPILDGLPSAKLELLRDRFRQAIESIYQPEPDGCAKEYVFGHIKGEARDVVRQQLVAAISIGAKRVEDTARAARDARVEYDEARRRHERVQDVSETVERLRKEMERAQRELERITRRLGGASMQETGLREDLKQKKAEIGRLETDLQRMAPAQQRIEVVNRVRDVLTEFSSQLAPVALSRLEAAVTKHFRAMADPRFRKGRIQFRDDGNPVLLHGPHETTIRSMSGYERRTFGIAFSLALAEVSGFRAPLVIDTPLGNADSEYRVSLLRHIVEADLDQIIILTHDEEVVGPYHDAVRDRVANHYLVKYQATGDDSGESVVYANRYFEARNGR